MVHRNIDSIMGIPISSRRTSSTFCIPNIIAFINDGIPTIISKFTHFSVELLILGKYMGFYASIVLAHIQHTNPTTLVKTEMPTVVIKSRYNRAYFKLYRSIYQGFTIRSSKTCKANCLRLSSTVIIFLAPLLSAMVFPISISIS